ncbi:Phosphoribosylformylglycinamidine synthase like protein [Verticillium longisporum]|nr:Phosphoribosylformylglycinamidine synthase like protein [Verticillium longisporum]
MPADQASADLPSNTPTTKTYYVTPRNISPWSSKGTSITHVCGLKDQIERIERGQAITGLIRKIGVVKATSKQELTIRYQDPTPIVNLDRVEMQQWWSRTSYAMQRERDSPAHADSEFATIADSEDPGISFNLKFQPKEDINPLTATILNWAFGRWTFTPLAAGAVEHASSDDVPLRMTLILARCEANKWQKKLEAGAFLELAGDETGELVVKRIL